jgi:lipopolysaccharide biosynthesis regulator YciM
MNLALKSLVFSAALALGAITTNAWSHDTHGDEHRAQQRGPITKARLARAMQSHPELAVAVDMRRLEMLYRKQGDEAAIVAMYQDLQKRTDHAKLHAFAERRLQHAERVAHPDQTIAELRARIDERLSTLR